MSRLADTASTADVRLGTELDGPDDQLTAGVPTDGDLRPTTVAGGTQIAAGAVWLRSAGGVLARHVLAAPSVINHPANGGGNPRVDTVVATFNARGSAPTLARVQGTPTAGATLDNPVGAAGQAGGPAMPANSIILRTARMAAGAAANTFTEERDRRPWAKREMVFEAFFLSLVGTSQSAIDITGLDETTENGWELLATVAYDASAVTTALWTLRHNGAVGAAASMYLRHGNYTLNSSTAPTLVQDNSGAVNDPAVGEAAINGAQGSAQARIQIGRRRQYFGASMFKLPYKSEASSSGPTNATTWGQMNITYGGHLDSQNVPTQFLRLLFGRGATSVRVVARKL